MPNIMYQFGVSMYLFDDILKSYEGTVSYRTLHGALIDMEKLEQIHRNIHGKPYDLNPLDWIEVLCGKKTGHETDKRFWCSALVAYIYVKLSLLPETYDWTLTKPNAFGRYGDKLKLTGNCKLGSIICIKEQ